MRPPRSGDRVVVRAVLRVLFAARTNVYAIRCENARTGRSGWSPAVEGGWRKGTNQRHLPLTDRTVAAHLTGEVHVDLQVLHLGPAAVPVLHLLGLGTGGDVEVGHDERVGEHAVELGEFRERERPLIWVQGAAAPRSRIAGGLAVAQVEPDPADLSRVVAGHQFGQ